MSLNATPNHTNTDRQPVQQEGELQMLYANVGTDGVIVFAPHADPTGLRLPMARANNRDAKKLRDIIEVNARHAYDGVTLLVPRMPDAPNQSVAMDAMLFFRRLIEMRMNGERGWPPVPASLTA